jgi:two-component system sensor histidine kinase KdpD
MHHQRGKLKIFFGAEAGVGKTFAMLEAALELKSKGEDVLVGCIESHGRPEIAFKLENLEILPSRPPAGQLSGSCAFDVDGALIRRPQLILVDDLARGNPEGCRNARRWQDVEELLDAGIDVFTTLNVQQLDSLNGDLAALTGMAVDATVPDAIFDRADEIKLIDLPPDELLARMKSAKIHLPVLSGNAIRHYYQKSSLTVMRQFAVRKTEEWLEAQTQAYLRQAGEDPGRSRAATDRVMVCVGPGSDGERLITAAKRSASQHCAPWLALYVETPALQQAPDDIRRNIFRSLALAERLGGEAIVVSGSREDVEILRFAATHGITKIILGKPRNRGWLRWLFGSVPDDIIAKAQDINIHIVADRLDTLPVPRRTPISWSRRKRRALEYAIAATLALGLIGFGLPLRTLVDPFVIVLVLVIGVYLVALKLGRAPSVLAAFLSAAGFAYYYAPPTQSFLLTDMEDLVALATMSTVAVFTSKLVEDSRNQAILASKRERYTKALFRLNSELAHAQHTQDMLLAAVRRVSAEFRSACTILLPDENNRLVRPQGKPSPDSLVGINLKAAQWAYDLGHVTGHTTETLREEAFTYTPLKGNDGPLGILVMENLDSVALGTTEHKHFFEAVLQQIAWAIERFHAISRSRQISVQVEREILRNSLLSSISHDLRTPLTAIFGAACVLEEKQATLTNQDQLDLARVIREQTQRMSDLTDKILDMVKLSGEVVLNREWHALEEIIARAMKLLDFALKGRTVSLQLPGKFTPVSVDATLLQQVMVNLLENACKYSSADSPIDISVQVQPDTVGITVEDRGPGIPEGADKTVFEKFVSFPVAGAAAGVGLGLNICKTIVEAHAGTISATARTGGGSTFRIQLPLAKDIPTLDLEMDNPGP